MSLLRELQTEWRKLLPRYDDDFEELCAMISLDERKPCPRTEKEVQDQLDKHVLSDESYEKKGPQMRQSSWYNILKLVSLNEGKWHAQKYHAQKVSDQLVKSPGGRKILKDTASLSKKLDAHRSRESNAHRSREQDDKPAMSTHQFKAQLKKLRKELGNSLLLAPKFYHTENCINARIMWQVGQIPYSEHAFWGSEKVTPESDCEVNVKYSTGLGEETLRAMWWRSVSKADDLARTIQ